MSPNSQPEVTLERIVTGENNKITMNSAALVKSSPEEDKPVKEPGFDEFLTLINGNDGCGASPENYTPTDPGVATASNEGDTAGDGTAEESNANDKKKNVPPNQTRRRSSELRGELAVNNLTDSVKTADSWGGKEGSLPPLVRPHRSTMPEFATTSLKLLASGGEDGDVVSDLDGDNSDLGDDPSPQDKNEDPDPSQRSKSWSQPKRDTEDSDDNVVANHVNFKKLLQPGSSQYYYSQANRSNRQMIHKIKSKKKVARGVSLDESGHSKVSILSEREQASSYRGPAPLKKDGSKIKSLMKVSRESSFSASVDSMPDTEQQEGGGNAVGPRRCSFSSVDIREHERVAGDNPCVTSGVPLSIGWGYYQHEPISLDLYESNKGPSRDKIEMMVPASIRKQILRDEFSVPIADMNAAMKEVNITKRQRRHTVATEHMEGWSEVLESAKRKFGRFVKGTSNAKEEEKVWAQAHKSAMSEYLNKHGESSLGKNPGIAGVGSINKGPKIVPDNNREAR